MHYSRLSCTTTEMTLNTNQNCVLYMCNLNSLNCSHVHTCLVPITISTPFPSSQPHNNCSSTMHCITESSPIKPCWLQVSGSNLKPTCIGSIHCCNPYSYQIKLWYQICNNHCKTKFRRVPPAVVLETFLQVML